MTTTEWAETHRVLASESSAIHGRYRSRLTPWVVGMHEALDDPAFWKVMCMKSAQVAWTDGVINNWLGRIIHLDPSPVIGLFPKEGSAKEYAEEKLKPMVTATRPLAERVDIGASRKDGNRALFKKFPGGFLKLVGSNSPSNVKSTPAPRVFVEEPDDAAQNVGKQGDSIKLLEERTKTYHRRKVVFGGTPSIKGLSTIESAWDVSDQRKFFVPCHDCGEEHVLSWDNVSWQEGDLAHQVFGKANPQTAVYSCPHCGSVWDDHIKNRNVRQGRWVATATSAGIAGFYINELYSPFPGSVLARLVERYLEAQHALEHGDETDMIVFVNSALGLPYEFTSNAPEADELQDRAEDYPELTLPDGALVVTAGVDVQHDRIAVTIWAWGPGEEMWLVYWGEHAAKRSTTDISDPVYDEVDKLLSSPLAHPSGFRVRVSAYTVDSSDGQTSDAVYHYVRRRQRRGAMAGKGSSKDYGDREIFSLPKKVDHKTKTKASRAGLQVYMIGTHKAKDLLIGDRGRITLRGSGPGRMHWYQDVRADFYEQLVSEVKAPHRSVRGKMVWQPRAGVRNEALDCTVMALHAARSLKLHIWSQAKWDSLRAQLMQDDLFAEEKPETQDKQPASAKQPDGWVGNSDGDWL